MRLIIVEHGQTEANRKGISQGHLDTELNSTGKLQSKAAGRELKSEHIDAAYSSDLMRAEMTAKEILEYHPKIELNSTLLFREQNKGIYEGKPRRVRDEKLVELKVPYHKFDFGGGETLEEVQRKVVTLFKQILKIHTRDSVLLVGHGGSITSLILYLMKKPFEEYRKYCPKNGEISILEIDQKECTQIVVLNENSHLRRTD